MYITTLLYRYNPIYNSGHITVASECHVNIALNVMRNKLNTSFRV